MVPLKYELSNQKLSLNERDVFSRFLFENDLDESIWPVFDCFLESASKVTKPQIIRAFDGPRLAGAAFVIECIAGGNSLFKNRFMAKLVNQAKIRCFLWFRQGVCADLTANPGFAADGYDATVVQSGLITHLREVAPALFITDLAVNDPLHVGAKRFPYTKEGSVSATGMTGVADYLKTHKKLKRKIKKFTKNGGTIEIHRGPLDEQTQENVLRCVRETMDSSIVSTPFQDHFPTMIGQSCAIDSDQVINVIARLHGEFVGYHAFVQSGNGCRMLHGAFDRSRPSLYHAYENLITGITEFAIEQGLEVVHFGPIMNETKRRMMNKQDKTHMYLYSNNAVNRLLLPLLYRYSSMQNPKLLAFS